MRTLIIPIAILLLVGACGGGEEEVVTSETTFKVQRGDLKITLTESGSLEPRHKTNVRPRIRRGEKIISLIEEGKLVKKGDVLAELDKSTIEKDIERFEDQIIQYETELKNARTELKIQIQTNESELSKAALDLEFARLELERWVKGDDPQKIRDLELKIDQAESRLKQAKEKYENMPKLREQGFVTDLELEEKRLAFDEAKVNLDSARLNLKLYREYTQPMDKKQKEADVTEAERELDRVKNRTSARFDSKQAVVRQKERQFEVAKGKLDDARSELGKLTIRAPQDGRVIYGGRENRWGGREDTVKVGETAYPGRTLIELPDMTLMDVHLKIHQADVTKVKKGQPAIVTIPGRRSAVFQATVADIGSVAQSTNWRDPIKRFKVVLEITERVKGLRAGVSVEVEIDVGELEGVVYIPLQAAAMSGGSYHAYVRGEDGVEKRRVVLGSANEQFVEVREGLKEGEEVLLVAPQVVAEDEDKNGEAKAGGNGGKPSGAGKPSGGGKPGGGGERPSRPRGTSGKRPGR